MIEKQAYDWTIYYVRHFMKSRVAAREELAEVWKDFFSRIDLKRLGVGNDIVRLEIDDLMLKAIKVLMENLHEKEEGAEDALPKEQPPPQEKEQPEPWSGWHIPDFSPFAGTEYGGPNPPPTADLVHDTDMEDA
jgi:hypothetical protein